MSKTNNYWRRQLIKKLNRLGGYHVSRGHNFPIEFMVYCSPILDVCTIRRALLEFNCFDSPADLELRHPDFDGWFLHEYGGDAQLLYEDAIERTCEDLQTDEGILMWSPKTAARYGFDYKGEGAEEPFCCRLEQHGRGGKHVCVAEFDGVTLEGTSNDDLIDQLEQLCLPGGNDYGPTYSNVWVRRLLGMIDEWSEQLTTANAEHSALFYACDRVTQDLNALEEGNPF